MEVTFLRLAEKELDEAFRYYESVQEGLGLKFLTEIAHSLTRIVGQPLSYQEIGKYSRRSLVHKFPYGVIYQYKEMLKKIIVVCIAHLHRKPDFWVSLESQT